MAVKKKEEKQVEVVLIKSFIGRKDNQIATANALGLKKIGDVCVHKDTPQIRGMVSRINHLVSVKEI